MKMKQEPKEKLYCHGCGALVNEKKLAKGKAVRREDAIYCRKCFRREFPKECSNHPGKPADAPCAMCGKPFCNDCIVTVLGHRVCEKCKKVILGIAEKGEDPLKTGALDLSKKPWEKVLPGDLREIAPRLLPSLPFYLLVAAVIGGLGIAALFSEVEALAGLVGFLMFFSPYILIGVLFANTRAQVKYIFIRNSGIRAAKGSGKIIEIPWDEVNRVSIGVKSTLITGAFNRIKIRKCMFLRYDLIVDVLREACKQKIIICTG